MALRSHRQRPQHTAHQLAAPLSPAPSDDLAKLLLEVFDGLIGVGIWPIVRWRGSHWGKAARAALNARLCARAHTRGEKGGPGERSDASLAIAGPSPPQPSTQGRPTNGQKAAWIGKLDIGADHWRQRPAAGSRPPGGGLAKNTQPRELEQPPTTTVRRPSQSPRAALIRPRRPPKPRLALPNLPTTTASAIIIT